MKWFECRARDRIVRSGCMKNDMSKETALNRQYTDEFNLEAVGLAEAVGGRRDADQALSQ